MIFLGGGGEWSYGFRERKGGSMKFDKMLMEKIIFTHIVVFTYFCL